MLKLIETEDEYDLEEIDHVWDDFFAEYPEIQKIGEYNYHDIVDLPDGYKGVEIGDTIYKFVNRTSIDMNESTGKQKMKFKKIVKEARLPVMWAIDYRNMHTGIHGLYYGKDRKRVEEFANEIEYIQKNDDWDWDEKQYTWDNLMEEFPDIGTIDEINFRDIGKLPSGKYGIIIDDVEYRLVNNVAMDIYGESKVKKESVDIAVTGELRPWVKKLMRMIGVGKSKVSSDDKKSLLEAVISACDRSEPMYADLVEIKDKYFETYDESKKMGLKFKKMVKEDDDGGSDHPRIYVGTYAKYNDGSIDGKWIDISEYNTYEEFVDACRELHKDEKDPEFMVQDYENFPEKWYHEGGLPTEEEFNKINDFYMMDDDRKDAYDVYINYTDDDDIEHFEDAYEGKFDSPADFGYYCVDNFGIPDNPEYYIDYESFGRDLTMDWHRGDPDNTDAEGEPEDPDYYYDGDGYQQMEYGSDSEVGEQYIDDIGLDNLGTDTLNNYFDYEEFGRTLLINDYFEEDGYVFLRM